MSRGMDTEALGKRLQQERIRRGMSLRHLATLADTDLAAIKRVEAGQSYDWMYGKVAKALNFDLAAQESEVAESSGGSGA